jgi:hypothetical protein
MDEQLIRSYLRWQEAEDSGRDDDADAAFGAVFGSVAGDRAVSLGFTARTMEAVAAAAASDARRARRTKRLLVPVAAAGFAAAAYFSASFVASAMSTTVVGLLELLIGAIVSVATSLQTGADVWTVLSNLGRAANAFIANPAVTVTIFAVQGIAITALVALQRLLGSDGESFR